MWPWYRRATYQAVGLASVGAGIADAAFDADSALSGRRRKDVERHEVGDDIIQRQPPQAGIGEDRAVHLAFLELA